MSIPTSQEQLSSKSTKLIYLRTEGQFQETEAEYLPICQTPNY